MTKTGFSKKVIRLSFLIDLTAGLTVLLGHRHYRSICNRIFCKTHWSSGKYNR